MIVARSRFVIACLLALSVVIMGCGTTTPEARPSAVALSQVSPLPTLESEPTPTPTPAALSQVSPLPTPASELAPTLTPASTLASIQLVVLHTNDNWGETEPCG